MSKDLTPLYELPEDDGFSGPLDTSRIGMGSYVRWNDAKHWRDRDDLTPPSPLLVLSIGDFLRRWKDGQHEHIKDKPLPIPDVLNSAIPVTEWERGIDGKPRP